MSCRKTILPTEPLARCQYPSKDSGKLCGFMARRARVHNGAMLTVCMTHAAEIEQRREPGKSALAPLNPTKEEHEEEERLAQARWDAERAKRPPRKPRTLDQMMADEEADMGRKLRRASRKGAL